MGGARDDRHPERPKPRNLLRVEGRGVVEDHGEVAGQLSEELRLVDGRRARRQDDDPAVADLPAVAVGAVDHAAPPVLAKAEDVGQVVDGTRCHDEVPRRPRRPVGQCHPEAATDRLGADGGPVDEASTVLRHLGTPAPQQLGRRDAVVSEERMNSFGGGVAWFARVDDHHSTA